MEPSEQGLVVRALRRLTIAIWALTAVLAVFVGMYLVAYLPSFSSPSSATVETERAPASLPKSEARHPDFYAMPLEKQIEAASAIAIAKYQKDGDRSKCVISEILKLTPGTKFYYSVGDEFRQCSHYPKANESRGDGQLMFFVGNPAEFRYSASFHGDRVGGLGDMPFDLLRKQIKESTK
jgi:hypothetical protein